MSEVEHFSLIVLITAGCGRGRGAVQPGQRTHPGPPPAIFLLAAAVASDVIPALGRVSVTTVQQVVTVALAVILFDGGMQIGWRRFRAAAGPVVWVGVAGTFVTAAALATLAHILFRLEWRGRRCCWARR
jgi:potassium/hydrogen antiporter